jgi:zinc protease
MGKVRFFRKIICLGCAAIVSLISAWAARPDPSWALAAQKKVLESGLTVIQERDTSSATTFLQIIIKGGKRVEPPGKTGLAFLTSRLAVEIPDTNKVQELISLASRISVASRGDYALITIECLSSNAEATIKIISKLILDPLFSGLRLDAVKKYEQHQSKIEQDDSAVVGHLANLHAFFANTGYEGSIYGDEKSLEATKGKDVKDFYKTYFVASNIIFSWCSDLQEEAVLQMVDKYFAAIPRGNPVDFGPLSLTFPEETKRFIERDTKQTFVSLAFPVPRISPRSYALSYLLETLLGRGPGSLLWPLRSEERLAYNVNCRLTQMQEGGFLEAYLETDNKKTDIALEALKRALAGLFEKGTTSEELEVTKTMAKANFLRTNEPKSMRATTLGSFEALGLGFGYFTELSSLLDSLTLEEVNAFIKEVFAPEKAFELVVGPKKESP